jgi:membrane-bound lytic murein transglycosylase B
VACLRKVQQFFYRALIIGVLLISAGCSSFAAPDDPADARAMRDFAQTMAAQHGMDATAVEALIRDEAAHQQSIIDAISNPAEALPWHRYRAIFLTDERIDAGIAYWNEHRELLDAVEQRYGVPAEIVVAIIGVETQYGRYRGRHRVLDALRTLAFAYPPRADFFRSELEAFLILTNEEGIDPRTPLGSYAGAMGVPQFIASSYRAYAVDFNGNGRRDLFSEPADAIGSVGNYFARHHWRADAPIAQPAQIEGGVDEDLLGGDLKPRHVVADLTQQGVRTQRPLAADEPARLLALETRSGPEYWLTLNNFYVITRYNHSPLYAMAVYQLAQAIKAKRR